MIDQDASNPTPRLPARAVALRELLRSRGADAADVPCKAAELARALGIAESTLKLARADLLAAGELRHTPSPGRTPSIYRLLQPADNPPSQPAEPTRQPAGSTGRAQPVEQPDFPRVHAVEPPCLEGVEYGDQDQPLPLRAHEAQPVDAQPVDGQPADLQPAEPVTPLQGIGQVAVGWAVNEQRRLELPRLAGSLLKKIGDQAKRMSDDGLELDELKAAVESLVAGGHTDLLLAHRKAQVGAPGAARGGMTSQERRALADAAAASQARRRAVWDGKEVLGTFEPGAMVEVWHAIATTWDRLPLPDETVRERWEAEFRNFPVTALLWALVQPELAERDWPPTWAQVKRVAGPELRYRRTQAQLERNLAETRERANGDRPL